MAHVFRSFCFSICCLVFLSSCGKDALYTKLSEQQANEMLAVLNSSGIDASKATEDGGTWQIQTSKDEFASALSALRAQGYPRDDFVSLGTVFKKEGFVSSPIEERARLMYGLSQELSRTLSSIDGVIFARVHLAVPESDPLSDKPKLSSASVFIKHRPDADMAKQIGQIKALVVNSVEGLPYDNVTVMLTAAQPSIVTKKVAMPSLTSNLLMGLITVIALIAVLTGITQLRKWLVKRTPVETPSLPVVQDQLTGSISSERP
jgi:type III secretion protein J